MKDSRVGSVAVFLLCVSLPMYSGCMDSCERGDLRFVVKLDGVELENGVRIAVTPDVSGGASLNATVAFSGIEYEMTGETLMVWAQLATDRTIRTVPGDETHHPVLRCGADGLVHSDPMRVVLPNFVPGTWEVSAGGTFLGDGEIATTGYLVDFDAP